MDEVTKRFGRRVKALRNARDWTQEHLGRAAGLDPKHIGAVERGEKSPSFEAVEKLAAALDVDPHELFLPDDRPVKMHPVLPPRPASVDFTRATKAETVAFLRDLLARLERLGQ